MSSQLVAVVLLVAAAADPKDDLIEAARRGDEATVKRLLDQGVDVNSKNAYGATALSYAADKGHVEVVRLLIQRKADVNVSDTFYKATPMAWAVMNNRAEVCRLLVEAGATGAQSALGGAVSSGQVEMVKALIATKKFDADALSRLMPQAEKHPAVKELLVKAGAKSPGKSSSPAESKAAPATPAAEVKTTKVEDRPRRVESAINWPQFRGAGASGVADGQFPPTTFDVPKGQHVRWKTPIPGLGHSCPVIWGDRVFLTTAISGNPKASLHPGLYGNVDSVDDSTSHVWKVYCLQKQTGKILWERTAHKGVPSVKRHLKGTHANPTPATDGRRLVVSFGSEGLFCYDLDGNALWQKNLGKLSSGWFYDSGYEWGFGSSPIIYRDLAIVQCDIGAGSFIAAFHLSDGRQVWRTEREEIPSWGTPTIVPGLMGDELVTNATKFARGYDPLSGKEIWRLGRHSEITTPTPIFGAGLIFVTDGYRPIKPVYAIRPGSRGDLTLAEGKKSSDAIVWSNERDGPYMATPIVVGDHFYACSTAGVVTCLDAKTGERRYSERLGGKGATTASPVAADGRIYFATEEAGVRVLKAGPKFELLAINPVGEVCMATPAISDGMLFLRTEHHLIAIGFPEK